MLNPSGCVVVDRWAGDCRVVAVKVEAAALRCRLEELLGQVRGAACALASALDLTHTGTGGTGRRWCGGSPPTQGDPHGLARHPWLARPLQDALLTGLLLAAGHPYRDELDRPGGAAAPGTRQAGDGRGARPAEAPLHHDRAGRPRG